MQSKDLDFVFSFWTSLKAPSPSALTALGFYLKDGYYHHPDTIYTLDFPAGPLAVGREAITSWSTLRQDEMLLHILTPTDSVRDRLASFFYYDDYSALAQAVAIAQSHPVNMKIVEAWAASENEKPKYEIFAARV